MRATIFGFLCVACAACVVCAAGCSGSSSESGDSGVMQPNGCAMTLTCLPNQLCTEATEAMPAACSPACKSGFLWTGTECIAAGTANCLPDPTVGSILTHCTTQHRSCTPGQGGSAASCGACLDGYDEVSGNCVEHVTCDPGSIVDPTTNLCRPRVRCADLTCPDGQVCVEDDMTDAQCRVGGCGPGEAPAATGSSCVMCNIDCAPTVGLGGTGNIYTARATRAGLCICETVDGYFWNEGTAGADAIEPCDKDGDGWVREAAKRALESTEDVALHENARCHLRVIDAFVLHNDFGQSSTVALPHAIGLYETARDDDDELIQQAVAQNTLATYNGQTLAAKEVNSLTKACVAGSGTARADFNGNGVEDIDEAQGDPLAADPTSALAQFSNFSYFMELHRSWFAPNADNSLPGKIHIQEKSRDAAAPDGTRLRLDYGLPPSESHWRECVRKRDGEYQSSANDPRFDFARYQSPSDDPAVWRGMQHASQFRCLRLIADSASKSRPNDIYASELDAEWVANQCARLPGVVEPPLGGTLNPADPGLSCNPVVALPDNPRPLVLWGAAKYIPYSDRYHVELHDTYLRGCVNECAEPHTCPGMAPPGQPDPAECVGDKSDFGLLHCGCGRAFGGASCEHTCSGDLAPIPVLPGFVPGVGSLFTSVDFVEAPRAGMWMCAQLEITSDAELVGGGLALTGELAPAAFVVDTPLTSCGTSTCPAGLVLSPDPIP